MESNLLPPLPAVAPPLRLVMPRAVPPGWPPDVFPRQVIASDHINKIRDSVYLWPGDVNGGDHSLAGVHSLTLDPKGDTAFVVKNAAGTAWHWYISSNGDLVSQTFRAIYAAGHVEIQPVSGTGAFAVYNPAHNALDWAINVNGNLATSTHRQINGVGCLELLGEAGVNPLLVRNVGNTAYSWYISPAGDLSSQTNAHIVGTGSVEIKPTAAAWPFMVLNQAQSAYDWYIDGGGHIQSSTFRVLSGGGGVRLSQAGGGASIALGQDYAGVCRGLMFGANQVIRWSNDANDWNGVTDTQISRGSAGSVRFTNPVDGTALYFHTAGGARFPSTASVRWSNSTDPSGASDLEMRRTNPASLQFIDPSTGRGALVYAESFVVVGTGFMVSPRYDAADEQGKTGTFTTNDGKTITVKGGVITRIV